MPPRTTRLTIHRLFWPLFGHSLDVITALELRQAVAMLCVERYYWSMTILSVLDQSPILSGKTPADAIKDTLALAKHADNLGYHRYWLAEHHSSGGLAGAAPEILIGQVAAETKHIRVGSGGVMLGHYSALKVAENFRMLETLFPGRIDLGIGRAPGSDQITDQALAVGPGSLGPQHYPQQVRDMIAWLHDKMPDDHPFAKVRAMPLGPKAPEVWLLGSSDQSAAVAAYFGAAFSFAHFIMGEGGPEVMEFYRNNFQPSEDNLDPQGSVGIFVICAETESEAEELMIVRDLSSVLQRTGRGGPVPTLEEAKAYQYSIQEEQLRIYNRRRFIWGDPPGVKKKINALAEAYKVDEFLVLSICPTFEARLKSYELLARVFELEERTVDA
ncbi:MAG: LLM class flavin-dependent oxidoreductase [Rhodospirillaceae bacterium]